MVHIDKKTGIIMVLKNMALQMNHVNYHELCPTKYN